MNRSLIRGRSAVLSALLFLLLALLPVAFGRMPKGNYYAHIAILVLLYAYLATAWNILGGYAGQHSLGNAVYLGAGAYTSTILFLKLGISPWIGMWVAGVVAALLGWFLGYACFRYGLRGGYFALVTIALAEAAVYLVTNVRWLGGAMGLEVPWVGHNPLYMQFGSKEGYYYTILVMAALALLYSVWLDRRRFGYYLVAVRENEEAADALGVDPVKLKTQANIISAFMTGVGGTFFAQYFTYIHPRLVFGEGPSVQILLFAIIGGLGTVWGPSLGALVLVPVAELARARLGGSFAGAPLLLYGVVLMVVMLFMPRGILGLFASLRARIMSQNGPAFARPRSEGPGG
jgi:branched-chain amino acid transport system permease protein